MKRVSTLVFAFCLLFATRAFAGGVIIIYKDGDLVGRPNPEEVGALTPGGPEGVEPLGKLPKAPLDRFPLGLESADAEAHLYDDEAMGCGGASAATGPAALLPLLVSGFALVRRRRG